MTGFNAIFHNSGNCGTSLYYNTINIVYRNNQMTTAAKHRVLLTAVQQVMIITVRSCMDVIHAPTDFI